MTERDLKRCVVAIVAMAVCLALMPEAEAQDGPTSADVVAVGLTATALGAGGAVGTVALLYSGCEPQESTYDESVSSDLGCFIGAMLVGVPLGLAVGSVGGAGLGGLITGYRGSFFAATVGGILGFFAGLGLFALDEKAGVAGVLLLPGVGAATGYLLTPQDTDRQAAGGALLNVDAAKGVSLGFPGVAIQPEEEGVRVLVPLLSGSF